ncbi:hypothetical protein SARC_08403 [Sphaeroforma arctica JP610]|uniref:Uncharacterized protein n=1 Tax=Sphaeroforma arctica JP610 TaxID=667725 RepID=A0A0L0FRK6_9EUKA|nr:hypothetical protein SARC_08403 [Sphaeroforma arctica JP610]KNC79191.1 hypothetical protein SARC_08403 [Sphaeroforma arctica JP610]|eukprot:XP_014153093.1 hypothetical protein SARC_08403 [Sphaeroforma arctica JP610]
MKKKEGWKKKLAHEEHLVKKKEEWTKKLTHEEDLAKEKAEKAKDKQKQLVAH